jgi:hypothetical protein
MPVPENDSATWPTVKESSASLSEFGTAAPRAMRPLTRWDRFHVYTAEGEYLETWGPRATDLKSRNGIVGSFVFSLGKTTFLDSHGYPWVASTVSMGREEATALRSSRSRSQRRASRAHPRPFREEFLHKRGSGQGCPASVHEPSHRSGDGPRANGRKYIGNLLRPATHGQSLFATPLL